MQAHTQRLRLEFEDSIARAVELAAKVDDQTLRRRPEGQSWCAAECFEHLSMTMAVYQRRIREALDGNKLRPARQREKISMLGRIFQYVVEPPVGHKFDAAGGFMPGAVPERYLLMKRFEQTHRAMVRLIEETDPIDRMRVKVVAPGMTRLRLPLLDTFSVLAAHDRRHLWQAERAARV